MPTNYKVLGQSSPSATTHTTLYTCPSSTQAVVSTMSICNRGSSTGTFRIYISPDGASLVNSHYVVYDAVISAKDTIFITIGATVDASDVIGVYASSSDFTFNAFGSEIT